MCGHDKGRSCERTDEVLDNYRRRAIAAETALLDPVRVALEAAQDPKVVAARHLYEEAQMLATGGLIAGGADAGRKAVEMTRAAWQAEVRRAVAEIGGSV